MRPLLKLSAFIDGINTQIGVVANWLILLMTLVSAGNAASRYLFSASSNAWLEIQWYMFAGVVLLGGPVTFLLNEHVRIDLIYSSVSDRARLWIDVLGIIFFLMPMIVLLLYFTWPYFYQSFLSGETSSNAGGLVRWPVKFLLPLGFFLLGLQGTSELIKRIAALLDIAHLEVEYEKPLQ